MKQDKKEQVSALLQVNETRSIDATSQEIGERRTIIAIDGRMEKYAKSNCSQEIGFVYSFACVSTIDGSAEDLVSL